MRDRIGGATILAVILALCVGMLTFTSAQDRVASFLRVLIGSTGCVIRAGTGTPEGAVTGSPCDIFLRTNGAAGTTLYVKETGSATNTGWASTPSSISVLPAASGGTGQSSYTVGDILGATGTTTLSKINLTDGWLLAGDSTGPKAVHDSLSIYQSTARCQGASATSFANLPNAATAASPVCQTGTNVYFAGLEYSDASNHISETIVHMPDDWDSANGAKLELHWTSTSNTGDVIWSVQTACIGVGETLDPALNAAQTVTTAAPGTADYRQISTIASLTVTGCAAGESLVIQVARDGSVAGDTIGAAVNLFAVELFWYRLW